MKSLIALWQKVLAEAGTLCGTSTLRDCKTAAVRFEHEGFSFFTLTLARFADDFERSLDAGQVDDAMFAGFRRHRGLPRFLSGFLRLVFDPTDGRLIDAPSVMAIQAVRQVTNLFRKILLPCSPSREARAFRQYVETDREVGNHGTDVVLRKEFTSMSRALFGSVFSQVDQAVYEGCLTPGHGPGAVADRLTANARYNVRSWPQRLDRVFPLLEFVLPSHRYHAVADEVQSLHPRDELPVKVVSVPKTLKAPRIIAVEPSWQQYVQQSLAAAFREVGARDDRYRALVDASSQQPNRSMAAVGSVDGRFATLDLSEASDRVSVQHVRDLTRGWAWLTRALLASRSTRAEVPGQGLVHLAKFASMGSATCFPVEAMVFCTAAFVGIQRALGRTLTSGDIESLLARVRVYGDDIIVPVDYVQSVIEVLEALGFKVNHRKSFWTGRFRESCGGEYYAGADVSYVKCRRTLPRSRTDASEVVSLVSFRNQMWERGWYQTVDYVDGLISKLIPFPELPPGSPHLGRWSFTGPAPERHDSRLHRPLVRVVELKAVAPSDPLDGLGALMKFFLLRRRDPLQEGHLERAGRPRRAHLQTRWVDPYAGSTG